MSTATLDADRLSLLHDRMVGRADALDRLLQQGYQLRSTFEHVFGDQLMIVDTLTRGAAEGAVEVAP